MRFSTLSRRRKAIKRALNAGGGVSAAFTTLNDYAVNVLKVDFTDASTGATSWEWDFGDGNTSTLQNPTRTYAAAGNYTVTLSINGGAASVSQNVQANAFHAAAIAAGFQRFYDYRETSGTTAVNDGSDGAGGNGTISGSPVLGGSDPTGNPDTITLTNTPDIVEFPSKTFSGLTAMMWVKADYTDTAGCYLDFYDSVTYDGGNLIISANPAGIYFGGGIFNSAFAEFAQINSLDNLLSANTWYLLFLRYNAVTGLVELRYSDDGTIKSPALGFNDTNPLPHPMPSFTADYLRQSGYQTSVSDTVTLGATGLATSPLSDAVLLPLAQKAFAIS